MMNAYPNTLLPNQTAAVDTTACIPLLAVPKLGLLLLYSVIPISLCLVLVDVMLLDQTLYQHWLPAKPEHWAFWTLIFNMPHITASLLLMADSEYLRCYRHQLLNAVLLISAGVLLLPNVLGGSVFMIILALYTMYHVLSQQFGISLLLAKQRPNRTFTAWRWLSVSGATLIYMDIYSPAFADIHWLGLPVQQWLQLSIGVMLLATVPLVYQLVQHAQTGLGRLYLWSNLAMMLTCYGFWLLDYSVFVILIPRVIHDLTAFMIYAVHDQNRNQAKPVNWIYRGLAFTHIPPLVLCPLVAIGVAWLLFDMATDIRWALWWGYFQPAVFLLYVATFLHYYIEGFIWKDTGLPRKAVRFA